MGHVSSMGMESLELLAAHHQTQQQQQRQLLAEHCGPGSMLSTTAQPTGGGSTQPLQQGHQSQTQGQDPLQSMVQQLVCLTQLQQLQYFLSQSGHI